jgi:putative Mn2+ efflux pump MntP
MSLPEIIGVAFGLAADAFAVAIGVGFSLRTVSPRQAFRLCFHFGLFQFMMPVIGWSLGLVVQQQIAAWDHWIAFALLAAIGGKMIRESGSDHMEPQTGDPTRGASLVVLSLATSIDALGVGLSLAMLRVRIWLASAVIGVVAAGMTLLGLRLGGRFGRLLGKRVEMVGGLVLVGVGLRILWDHLV